MARLRQLRRRLALTPVTWDPDIHLMPTSPFQQINNNGSSSNNNDNSTNSSTNNRLLMRDQAQDLFSHPPPPTLLTSVNGLILTPRRPTPVCKLYNGVMVLQPPLRSVQANPSHTHQ